MSKSKAGGVVDYRSLSAFLRENLSRIPKAELVDLDDYFDKSEKVKKEVGMTSGILVPKKGSSDGEMYLVKKSSKIDSKKKLRLDVEKMARESFGEKCASVLFDTLKQVPEYLPEILLVKSGFSEVKFDNSLKREAGLPKIYIASKIIGDPSKVNDQRKYIENHELFRSSSGLDLETQTALKDDLCENAVIMFLISNYDIKLDNFVRDGKKMVPIDFGNARYEEKNSPDILNGIDVLRFQNTNKSSSNRFATSSLQGRFSSNGDSDRTQKFYKQNLAPKHFLKVIERIKENQTEIEEKLRGDVFTYSFGNESEKNDYADVLVSRVRNLLKLEPIFVRLNAAESPSPISPKKGKQRLKKFSDWPLRDLLTESEEFKESVLESECESGNFFKSIAQIFESIKEQEEQILKSLNEYVELAEGARHSKAEELLNQVGNFNNFLGEKNEQMSELVQSLETHYSDSEYIRGENKFDHQQTWGNQRDELLEDFANFCEILKKPLIKEVDDYKRKEQQGKGEWSEEEYAVDESEEFFDFSDSPDQKPNAKSRDSDIEVGKLSIKDGGRDREGNASGLKNSWDLTRSQEYQEGLNKIIKYTSEKYLSIESNLLILLSHLDAHDTLIGIQDQKTKEIPAATVFQSAEKLSSAPTKSNSKF